MFETNQKVWCAIYGEGIVKRIRQNSGVEYPVLVLFNSSTDDESVVSYTNDGKYRIEGNVTLYPYPVEIVKATTTKPSIDWDHVSSEYNYLVQDSDGEGYLCSTQPERTESGWNTESSYTLASTFTSYVPGTCDWRDSLVKRPELVQEI